MTTSAQLDSILKGCGLSDELLRSVGVQSGHAPPAASQAAPPPSQRPTASPTAAQGQGEASQEPGVKATAIPSELRARPQWVGWKSVPTPGAKKPRKLPVDPKNGKAASSTDPSTWTSYDTAIAAVKRYGLAGVGFVFTAGDSFCGVDLDDCRNPDTGEIAECAQDIIAKLNCYSEVSPSQTGVKIFIRAKLPANAKHNTPYQAGSVEVYDRGRYFTVTGAHVEGTPATIEDRQAELTAVYADVFGAKAEQAAPAAGAVVGEPIGKSRRTPRMVSLAGTLLRQGADPATIEAALLAENAAKCSPPLPESKVRAIAHDIPARYPRPLPPTPQPTTFSDFLQDPRPKIRLRGDNRLLSDLASELGSHLAQVLYTHVGEVVELLEGLLCPVSAQRLRTLAERHVVFYRVKSFNANALQVGATLDESDARGIIVSPQFRECLNPICHVNTTRLPVIRSNGRVELLPEGYDIEAATLTSVQAPYAEDMVFSDAVETIDDLYSEFRFSDGERSLSVAVAALMGLYAKQLVRPGELRPAYTFVKNAEGAGASTLAACAIVPILGDLPTGVRAKDDDEMRKSITSAIRCGKDVLFLDNLKDVLSSPSLEAFTSAAVWTDRLLGSNDVVTGPNTITVFCTANGLSISPDWRRRSLFAELHLSEELAEDRTFRRPLSVPILKAMRPQILAACWSLIRHWDELGRPQPSRSHSAFPEWAATVGGIVEAAGFSCPFETAKISIVADEDGQNMRLLVAEMLPGTAYTSAELVALCRQLSIFDGVVGSSDDDMGRPQRFAFGKLLARYDDRQIRDVKFSITGTGHGKRFRVLRPADVAEQAAEDGDL